MHATNQIRAYSTAPHMRQHSLCGRWLWDCVWIPWISVKIANQCKFERLSSAPSSNTKTLIAARPSTEIHYSAWKCGSNFASDTFVSRFTAHNHNNPRHSDNFVCPWIEATGEKHDCNRREHTHSQNQLKRNGTKSVFGLSHSCASLTGFSISALS